jgi:hypothetical protein
MPIAVISPANIQTKLTKGNGLRPRPVKVELLTLVLAVVPVPSIYALELVPTYNTSAVKLEVGAVPLHIDGAAFRDALDTGIAVIEAPYPISLYSACR